MSLFLPLASSHPLGFDSTRLSHPTRPLYPRRHPAILVSLFLSAPQIPQVQTIASRELALSTILARKTLLQLLSVLDPDDRRPCSRLPQRRP